MQLNENDSWREQIKIQTKYVVRNPILRFLTNRFLDRIVSLSRQSGDTGILLDAGCGEGITLKSLEKALAAWTMYGLDVDPESITVARKVVPQARLQLGSVYQLPFPDQSFDLVLCTEVLEHLEHPRRALRELCRVARRDVILSVPREPLWRALNMARGAYLRSWGNTAGHINHWSRRGFQELVAARLNLRQTSGPLPWTVIRASKPKTQKEN